ncbi:hypothetical protein MMC10_002483 [Thelotrema lepadinum]|nr:hypothetical protein [Thelotrema lepadinum]
MDRNYGHAKPQEEQILVRSWIPAEGIERQVLQAEVQFYLGSRATSRPREHEVGNIPTHSAPSYDQSRTRADHQATGHYQQSSTFPYERHEETWNHPSSYQEYYSYPAGSAYAESAKQSAAQHSSPGPQAMLPPGTLATYPSTSGLLTTYPPAPGPLTTYPPTSGSYLLPASPPTYPPGQYPTVYPDPSSQTGSGYGYVTHGWGSSIAHAGAQGSNTNSRRPGTEGYEPIQGSFGNNSYNTSSGSSRTEDYDPRSGRPSTGGKEPSSRRYRPEDDPKEEPKPRNRR